MTTVNKLVVALAFFEALGSGMMAGLFFTFSNFVTKALAGLSPDKGIVSML
jgi:uncharacterized membrane protein